MTAVAQKGFRLDLNLCTGCGACAVACAIENELDWGTSWRFIETFNPRHQPGLPHYHLSLACNHCADAPCMNHCPALAYHKDDRTGAVLLDPDTCLGCKYCTWACPYAAPRFDAKAGVVSKCTFCHHRQLDGLAPACVGQCPTGALTFDDLDQLSGQATVAGFPETTAGPSIRFEPLRPGSVASAGTGETSSVRPFQTVGGGGRTTLASEGPLVVFTLLVALSAGLMASPSGRAAMGLPVFVAIMTLAGGASTLHLGRKKRAWRALLNLRRSWLSREIALFSVFAVLGAAALAPATLALPRWLPAAAAVTGAALLFSVDRVYAVTEVPGLPAHSAGVLLTGVLVAGLGAGMPWVWGGAVLVKTASFLWRLRRWPNTRVGFWGIFRLGPGLVLPAGVLLASRAMPMPVGATAACLALLALGEVVDRSSFYLELGRRRACA